MQCVRVRACEPCATDTSCGSEPKCLAYRSVAEPQQACYIPHTDDTLISAYAHCSHPLSLFFYGNRFHYYDGPARNKFIRGLP